MAREKKKFGWLEMAFVLASPGWLLAVGVVAGMSFVVTAPPSVALDQFPSVPL